MHSPDSVHPPAGHVLRGFGQTDLAIAGPGRRPSPSSRCRSSRRPSVSPPRPARASSARPSSCATVSPLTGGVVMTGELPAWKARRVARETIRLTPEAAAFVDSHVAPVAHRVKPAQLDRAVNEAIGRFMPAEVERLAEQSWDKRHVTVYDQLVSYTGTMRLEAELDIADAIDFGAAVAAGAAQREACGSTEPLDVRRAQAVGDLARRQLALDLSGDSVETGDAPGVKQRQVVLHVHVSEAAVLGLDDPVARLERGDALVSVDQVRARCGNPDAEVVVKPVIDLATCLSTDSGQVPPAIAEQVALRDRTCAFPWCTRPGPPVPPRRSRRTSLRRRPRGRAGPRRSHALLQPRSTLPAPPSPQDPRAVELPRRRPGHLPVDQPARVPVPARPDRHSRRECRPPPPRRGPARGCRRSRPSR